MLCSDVFPLRDSFVGNNDDLVPALAEGLIVRFLLRSRLRVLVILLVPLVWTLRRIVPIELYALLVDILKFVIACLVVAIPITIVVLGIIPALTSVVLGIVPGMASVVVCIILVLAIGVIALVVSEIVTVIEDSPVRPGLDVAI